MKFHLWGLLAATAGIAMLLQLSWQIPEVWREPFAIVAAIALLVLGLVTGSLASHSLATRRAIRLLAFFFFVVLGIQWANSFRDDHLIWGFRWMCLGLMGGSFLHLKFSSGATSDADQYTDPIDELESDEAHSA